MAKVVLRIRRKGILILPKGLRERLNVDEGDELVAEASGGALVLRPLRPKLVDIDPKLVEGLLAEEGELEMGRAKRIAEARR